MNHDTQSTKVHKIIFGNKYLLKNNEIFVKESTFDSPLWQQLSYAPELLGKLQNSQLDNTEFLELFKYKNFSLYWFFYPFIYAETKNASNLVIELTQLIHNSQSSHVHIDDNFKYLNSIEALAKKEKQNFSFSKYNYLKYKSSKKLKLEVRKNRLDKISNLKTETRKNMYYEKYSKAHDLDDKIIFASPEIFRRPIIDSKNQVIENGEFITQEIINQLDNSVNSVGLSLDYDIKPNFHKLDERLNSSMPWMPIEVLLSTKDQHSYHDFLSKFDNLIANDQFQKLFTFNEINYWDSFERVFQQMKFSPYIPFWLNLFDSLNNLFQNSRPKAVILLYETGPLALALIHACKQNNIKTISVQHGIIAKNWKYYTINPLETQSDFGFPLPDRMLMYGDFSKKILLENNFPEKKLVTFGNPEFFNLESKKKILSKTNLKNKYEITKDQKIILFTPIVLEREFDNIDSKLDYNVRIWKNLLENFKDRPEFYILLKPHPGDNSQNYQKILEKIGCKNAHVVFDNVLEIISISDLVVTMFSSIIVDALCLGKNVLEINYANTESPIQFNKMGIVTQSNLENIRSDIDKIFDNSQIQTPLTANNAKIVKEIYNIPENNIIEILKNSIDF